MDRFSFGGLIPDDSFRTARVALVSEKAQNNKYIQHTNNPTHEGIAPMGAVTLGKAKNPPPFGYLISNDT